MPIGWKAKVQKQQITNYERVSKSIVPSESQDVPDRCLRLRCRW
jgi:hypothetical protein